MDKESIFLTFTALGLIVLAGFDNYGLYIAIGVFWIIAAFNKYLGLLALWSTIIFYDWLCFNEINIYICR